LKRKGQKRHDGNFLRKVSQGKQMRERRRKVFNKTGFESRGKKKYRFGRFALHLGLNQGNFERGVPGGELGGGGFGAG